MYRLIAVLSSVILLMLCVSVVAYAQPFPPASSSDGAPIDGLVSVMILASVGYGAYRLKDKE